MARSKFKSAQSQYSSAEIVLTEEVKKNLESNLSRFNSTSVQVGALLEAAGYLAEVAALIPGATPYAAAFKGLSETLAPVFFKVGRRSLALETNREDPKEFQALVRDVISRLKEIEDNLHKENKTSEKTEVTESD